MADANQSACNSCTAKNDLKEVSLEIRGHYDWKKVYTRYQIE